MSEEDYEGMDYDELDEEEQEIVQKQMKPKDKQKKNLEILKKKVKRPSVRFSAFQMPARIGIVDNETQEVVAEGEAGIYQCLANIIERLERIEYKIGNILEE